MPQYKVVGERKLGSFWEDREKDCGGCIVRRYKYDGRAFYKETKRHDEPQGGRNWPTPIPATEDGIDVVDRDGHTLQKDTMWYLLEKVHGGDGASNRYEREVNKTHTNFGRLSAFDAIRSNRLHVADTATMKAVLTEWLGVVGKADLAEWREKLDPNETISPGHIVQERGGKVTRNIIPNRGPIFIVSTEPAIVLGTPPADKARCDHTRSPHARLDIYI